MPAAASLTFTPLTDPVVWFATVQAFNQWVGEITVTIGAANLPAATTAAIGGVKMATLSAYVPETVVPTWVGIISDENGDGVAETVNVPSQQAYTDLKTKLDNCAAKLDALMDALEAAGSLDIT